MADLQVESAVECPSCGALALPEQDGECLYLACSSCEYEFGYQLIKEQAGACQLGVPAAVQAKFQAPPPPSGTTFLGQIGRRPDG